MSCERRPFSTTEFVKAKPEIVATGRIYVVPNDLRESCEALNLASRFPNPIPEQIIEDVATSLQRKLMEWFPENTIFFIDFAGLKERTTQKLEEAKLRWDAIGIVFDPQLFEINKTTFPLQVNRLYSDKNGEKLGIGARPGFLPLKDQLQQTVAFSPNKRAVLGDSGFASGGTMEKIIRLCQQSGLDIKEIVVGVSNEEVEENFYQEMGCLITSVFQFNGEFVDWTYAKDFLFGLPRSGQVVGRASLKDQGVLKPLFDPGTMGSIAIPYPLGFIDCWASIPKEYEQEAKISLLRLSKKLFATLEEANNNQPFLFRDLLEIQRRSSNQTRSSLPLVLAGPKSSRFLAVRVVDFISNEIYGLSWKKEGKSLDEILTRAKVLIFDVDNCLIAPPFFAKAGKFYKSYEDYNNRKFAEVTGCSIEEAKAKLDWYRKNFDGRGELAWIEAGYPNMEPWFDQMLTIDPRPFIKPAPLLQKFFSRFRQKRPEAKIVFLTNAPTELCQRILDAAGFDLRIADRLIGWRRGQPMPKNESGFVFRQILTLFDAKPWEAVAIGDSQIDYGAAQRWGFSGIKVGQRKEGNPEFSFPSILEIPF